MLVLGVHPVACTLALLLSQPSILHTTDCRRAEFMAEGLANEYVGDLRARPLVRMALWKRPGLARVRKRPGLARVRKRPGLARARSGTGSRNTNPHNT